MRQLAVPLLALLLAGCGEDTVVGPDPTLPPATLGTWGVFGSDVGEFNQPTALAVGPDGSIYVEDNQNHRVQKFSNDGEFLLSFGGEPGVPPVWFTHLLTGIAAYGDRVYVSDLGTAFTHVFTAEGEYLTSWDYFSVASGLAVFPNGDVLLSGFEVLERGYITEILGPYVWRLDPEGNQIERWAKPVLQVTTDREGNFYGIATEYTGIYPKGIVYKYSPDGTVLADYSIDTKSTVFDAVAVNSRGYVFVANRPSGSILKFIPSGKLMAEWSSVSDDQLDLGWPSGLARDADDNLFVSDLEIHRIVKYARN